MKANELRIGNYLTITDINQLVLVTEITKEYIHYDSKTRYGKAVIEYFEPIPLTEEWLFKFGFKYNSATSEYYDNYAMVYLQTDNMINSYIAKIRNEKIKEIRFVHELQNLYFALTNIELIIN